MNILVFGIHPDDIELGCGGTVILAADQGHTVTLADLSDGSASSNGTVEERRKEALAAAGIMGVQERLNLGFADAGIQSQNLKQREAVVACIRRARPEVVLAPSADDPHPDHASGAVLVQRALYLAGIYGYGSDDAHKVRHVLVYAGRSEIQASGFVVDITSVMDRKMKAIAAHATQFGAGKDRRGTPLNSPEFLPFIEARARVYGRQILARYGEPFQATGPVKLSGFDIFESQQPK
jgi:bacillithiol biosynthesis deacetylase BshB1